MHLSAPVLLLISSCGRCTDLPSACSFYFLLVFVFGTIPAGIYAKQHYNSILADVDYLHGSAESLLTVTNLLIGEHTGPAGYRQRHVWNCSPAVALAA